MATDYSHWLTKVQAAEAIGVSTKTIEKLSDRGEIQGRDWKRPGRVAVKVYHPNDVERVRKERNPDSEPFVIPPANVSPTASQTSENTLVKPAAGRPQSPLDALAALAGMMRPPDRVRVSERLFLTVDEAVEYSGLPQSHLRQLLKSGRLAGMKTGAGWRIRRADLEKL
jgi:excisionase family DNA binding protein